MMRPPQMTFLVLMARDYSQLSGQRNATRIRRSSPGVTDRLGHQRSLARSARSPRPTWNQAGGHRLTPMDRLFLAVIVTALMLLVFSSALLVDRSQSPVTLIERPEKAKGGRP